MYYKQGAFPEHAVVLRIAQDQFLHITKKKKRVRGKSTNAVNYVLLNIMVGLALRQAQRPLTHAQHFLDIPRNFPIK
ncbi:MAG: hypothetical protein CVU51_01000 [Deltaproteobacteria bacterium HGW-Deltaproteobacteria-1]|nr:MAG: hypothetical protein CVU51_01000 [Deltaproteobacteria bacterium HGW-Deltaproteobacteria-1]